MKLEAILTIGFYATGLAAIACGLGCAVSPSWSSVAVGGILLSTVVLSRLRGGKTE